MERTEEGTLPANLLLMSPSLLQDSRAARMAVAEAYAVPELQSSDAEPAAGSQDTEELSATGSQETEELPAAGSQETAELPVAASQETAKMPIAGISSRL